MSIELKIKAVSELGEQLKTRLESLQTAFSELQESLLREEKSTAGDKHETGRAMTQLELEKLGKQLKSCQLELESYQKIDYHLPKNKVQTGALVIHSKGNFLIGIAGSKLNCGVMPVSVSAPLVQSMINLSAGDSFPFQGQSDSIKAIF